MSVDLSIQNKIAILTINNPHNLNALSSEVMNKISDLLYGIEKSANVLIIFGTSKAFAAGVDIEEINSLSFEEAYTRNFIDNRWESIRYVPIPVIAGVSGYALGGGFELALMCDIIIASENAKFGFPEINLGLMPGMGGTQMLSRIVGTKKATEIIMTGEIITANEAKNLNIVSRVVDNNKLSAETVSFATNLSQKSYISLRMIKESIKNSQNVSLNEGISIERQMFRSMFATESKKQGVQNFINKRKNNNR